MNSEGFPAGTLISVWKPEWNAYHFGFTDGNGGCIHYVQESPKDFIEMSVGKMEDWKRCPIEDYEFVNRTLDGLSEVRMRPCQS